MSMTWQQILDLYLQITSEAPQAQRERFIHLTQGSQWVSNRMDLPELKVATATVPTVIGQDYVEHDCGAYAIRFVVDLSTARKLDPEEDGMRGRVRFFAVGTDKPPSGSLHRWVRDGNRIYLRDTPSAAVTLQIGYRMQIPEITSATDLTDHPITPEQYDYAIALAAAASYFRIHPPLLPPDGTPDLARYRGYEQMALEQMQGQNDPVGLENRDQHFSFRVPGYSFGVMGR